MVKPVSKRPNQLANGQTSQQTAKPVSKWSNTGQKGAALRVSSWAWVSSSSSPSCSRSDACRCGGARTHTHTRARARARTHTHTHTHASGELLGELESVLALLAFDQPAAGIPGTASRVPYCRCSSFYSRYSISKTPRPGPPRLRPTPRGYFRCSLSSSV